MVGYKPRTTKESSDPVLLTTKGTIERHHIPFCSLSFKLRAGSITQIILNYRSSSEQDQSTGPSSTVVQAHSRTNQPDHPHLSFKFRAGLITWTILNCRSSSEQDQSPGPFSTVKWKELQRYEESSFCFQYFESHPPCSIVRH